MNIKRYNPMIGGRYANIPAMGEDNTDGQYIRHDDFIAALEAVKATEGESVLVPRKMTAAMINAWSGGLTVSSDEIAYRTSFQEAWARVLTAASVPSPALEAKQQEAINLIEWIEDYALADPDLGEIASRAGKARDLLLAPGGRALEVPRDDKQVIETLRAAPPTQDEEAGNHAALSDNLNKEFPPEIVVAAERLLDQVLCNDSESCGGTDGLRTAATHDIASALMSERHRWFVAIDAHKDRIEELQAALEANQQVIETLRAELSHLMLAYVRLLEDGRDRIIGFGGSCDPVDVMEAASPALRRARAAITPTQPEPTRGQSDE